MKPSAVLVIALAVAAPLGSAAPLAAQTKAKPRLVIIGGGLSRENRAVYEEIVRGREGSGPLCVVPTASTPDGAERSMASAVETITRYSAGAPVVGVLLTTANAKDADKADVAVRARPVGAVRPDGRATAALNAGMERFRQGAVVSGSSAGAGMVSDPMIAGGSSAGALRNGVRRDTGSAGVNIERGLGFFTGGIVDQHFLARGRIARLIVATLELSEYKTGIGIDENTALVAGNDEVWVTGASPVVGIDSRDATRQGGTQGGTGIRVALLSAGAGYRPSDGRTTFDASRPVMTHTGAAATGPAELFSGRAFQGWLRGATRSTTRGGSATGEGYRFTLTPMPDFTARGTTTADPPMPFSAGPWRLDLLRN